MADDISIKLATSEDAGAVLQFLRATATESDAVLVPHLNEISEKTEAKNCIDKATASIYNKNSKFLSYPFPFLYTRIPNISNISKNTA